MKPAFWHDKWEQAQIGFHNNDPHPLLVTHFSALQLKEGARVFLPLCGKTRDIAWLLARGYEVVGAELSEIAVQQLFAELDVEPSVDRRHAWARYSALHIDVFVGDIFDVQPDSVRHIDAVYDRAALVALPETMRPDYVAHVAALTDHAPQLLISVEYDQSEMKGPPFSITDDEIERCYADHFEYSQLASVNVVGGLKGRCDADENVWLLRAPQLAHRK
ncbi:MAG: thiopurine S-methyltransferase [Pseudomonadota bacterium]